jgi:carotenoid cleavage dioxygenase
MATPYPQRHPLMSGPFEPIRFECAYADLVVAGDWPAELEGALYRIGPNPQFAPRGPYNPLQGDGMVHAFRIANGCVDYRNRWVRTSRWRLEREAGRALFATSDPRGHDPSVAGAPDDGAANTNLVFHHGRLLALEEGHPPIEIDPESLETAGPFDFGGGLPGSMTAHPKIDPVSGEMIAFCNFPGGRFDGSLELYEASRSGEVVRRRLEGPFPALVHDFAITPRNLVFVVCPVTVSMERVRAGGPAIAWEPALGTRVAVVPRDGGEAHWYRAPPCMAWHLLNAFEDGGNIVVDLCQQAAPAFPFADGSVSPEADLRQYLARWTLDPVSEIVAIGRLSEIVCEYPRIDERKTGSAYRFGFFATCGGPGTGDLVHRGLGRYDHSTGRMEVWRGNPDEALSEPVFAPRRPDAAEGDGWLLATIFSERSNRSRLAIFDANRLEDGPLAMAHLDHRVPAGFHGIFVAAP